MTDDANKKTIKPRSKHQAVLTLSGYIYKVLKSQQSEMGCSSAAMVGLNQIANHLYNRLFETARKAAYHAGRTTLNEKDIKYAVSVTYPADLRKHALSEIAKANTKYVQSRA
jgi:histone H3/H4